MEALTLGTHSFRVVTVILHFQGHRDDAKGMHAGLEGCHKAMELEGEPLKMEGKRRGMRPLVLCKLVAPMLKNGGWIGHTKEGTHML